MAQGTTGGPHQIRSCADETDVERHAEPGSAAPDAGVRHGDHVPDLTCSDAVSGLGLGSRRMQCCRLILGFGI